tara:strand:+ start:457 stop:678 length:222 start_codon:yes stop_codon:yes gene_type:complete
MSNNSEISELIIIQKSINDKIYDKKDEIKQLEDKLKRINEDIYTKCSHEWEHYDTGGAYSERYYYCKVCKLPK